MPYHSMFERNMASLQLQQQQPSNASHDGSCGQPLPTIEEVRQCQFSSWYPLFRDLHNVRIGNRRRKNVTIPSHIVSPLPLDFRDFLLHDGVQLPKGATELSSAMPSSSNPDEWSDDDDDDRNSFNRRQHGNNNSNDGDDEEHDNNDVEPSLPARSFHFPQLNKQIKQAIDELGGAVIPKLNWSAPKDATWMNQGSLKCETPGDVYLLLQSSDFILHDVLHALDNDNIVDENPTNGDERSEATTNDSDKVENNDYPPLELVLRKWCNLHASMEFRCFVYEHQLVAVSQRNHTLHFPHLVDRQSDILFLIQEFLQSVVLGRFPLSKFVLDVYLDQQDRIWIVDFNVWGRQTDALLFDWDELVGQVEQKAITTTNQGSNTVHEDNDNSSIDAEEQQSVDFRLVENEMQVRQNPLASYRAPIDTIHLSSITGGDATKFQEFMAMCQRPGPS